MKPQQKPGQFDNVARIIAKGKPPEWLVAGLELIGGFVGVGLRTPE